MSSGLPGLPGPATAIAPIGPVGPPVGPVGSWCGQVQTVQTIPGTATICMGPMCAAPGGPVGGSFWQQSYEKNHGGYPRDMGATQREVCDSQESFFQYESWEEEEEDYSERIRAAQLQARYEKQLKTKDEELRYLQERLTRREDESARMQADFERDRQGLLYNLNQLSHAVAKKKVQDRREERPREKRGVNEEVDPVDRYGVATQRFPREIPRERATDRVNFRIKAREDGLEAVDGRPERARKLPVGTSWSGARIEKYVRHTPGALELKPEHGAEGTQWTLKLCMDDLNPPLNDEGMQVFCRWLHHTLQIMREQHGIRSMGMVWADISLAWNSMGDDAVGRLLQALRRSQLRVRCLNFCGNGLGPDALSHICDFIHETNFKLRQVDLAHNMFDEIGALELLTLIADHPGYFKSGHKVETVKLDLSHNGLHSSKILKKLGSLPGLSLQSLRRPTQHAREWQVLKNGLPLMRLTDFEAQDSANLQSERQSRRRSERQGRESGKEVSTRDSREAREEKMGPPEETPEPQRAEKGKEKEKALPMACLQEVSRKHKKMESLRWRPEGFKKVLRHRDFRTADVNREPIEEHPNEDYADEEVKDEQSIFREDETEGKTVDGNMKQEEVGDECKAIHKEKAEKYTGEMNLQISDTSPQPVRLTAPPKILQRGDMLSAPMRAESAA